MKPRVFVSSTFYDLKYIRNDLEHFISDYGFEPILFESNGITFRNDEEIDESCYKEINNSHIVVLIIGGRYGSPSSSEDTNLIENYKKYTSVTLNEYRTALNHKIPIYAFVDKNVDIEYSTFKKNEHNNANMSFAYADDVNVYNFIGEIYKNGLFVFKFENFQDIKNTLKDQWAGLMHQYLLELRNGSQVSNISNEINRLQATSEKINIAIEGLIDKTFADDSEKKNEISEKQIEVEYEAILNMMKLNIIFDSDAENYSADKKRQLLSQIVEDFRNVKDGDYSLIHSNLKDIEGVTYIALDTSFIKRLVQLMSKIANNNIDNLIDYLMKYYIDFEFLPF